MKSKVEGNVGDMEYGTMKGIVTFWDCKTRTR